MTEGDPALVDRKLSEHFAPDEREQARTALTGIDSPRVQLAAIKLAEGSVADLERYAALARVDWRDVLAWAESPRTMAAGASRIGHVDYEDTVARDEADYRSWVETPGPHAGR